jgi:hypothetical protein
MLRTWRKTQEVLRGNIIYWEVVWWSNKTHASNQSVVLVQNFEKLELLSIYHKTAGQEQLCQKDTDEL